MCKTRWIQRIGAADIFKRLFLSIVECLENDGPGLWSADSLTDAKGLQLAITTTEFVSALVITNSCLKYMVIQALTSSLKAEAKDIVAAVREIDTVTATLKMAMLTHIILDGFLPFLRCCHKCVWSHLCHEDVVGKSTAAICQLTPRLSTIDAPSPSLWFATFSRSCYPDLAIIREQQYWACPIVPSYPLLLVSLESNDCISRVKELADLYASDLPSPECLESEPHSWHIKWQQQLRDNGESSLPTNLTLTLRHISSMYPNITALVKILCTLPVTSCSAERSFMI